MSVLAGFFSAWRPRDFPRIGSRARVRLLPAPARAPETEAERALTDTLAAWGPLSRGALVSHAASALYRHELTHGGGLADLGLFGESLFASEVRHALETAQGVLWEIELS